MLSPIDLDNKEFSKKIFGYSEDEVNSFLAEVFKDYETLYKENIEMKDKVRALEEATKHYKTIEDTLQQTLMVAQSSAEDIRNNDTEKAELVIKEAEIQASTILENANKELLSLNSKCEELKTFFNVSKAKMESVFTAQLELLKQTEIK